MTMSRKIPVNIIVFASLLLSGCGNDAKTSDGNGDIYDADADFGNQHKPIAKKETPEELAVAAAVKDYINAEWIVSDAQSCTQLERIISANNLAHKNNSPYQGLLSMKPNNDNEYWRQQEKKHHCPPRLP